MIREEIGRGRQDKSVRLLENKGLQSEGSMIWELIVRPRLRSQKLAPHCCLRNNDAIFLFSVTIKEDIVSLDKDTISTKVCRTRVSTRVEEYSDHCESGVRIAVEAR
jgi:hypothetical protein